ncbi:DUF7662 domain-containing protein [Brevundimonas aurantiaca]|uniref:DUF7662 domain-containing protein n=1 Tax=Brevundimonas aurantiaca TaxID=74316 RepID=UPI001CD54766|nr:toxin-antitoxin system, antitoxin component [Brevundimonas aurantiaca]
MRRFLRHRRHNDDLTLTFFEIERIIGAPLPKAVGKAEWWSNAPPKDRYEVQRNAWLDAGYHAVPGPKETVTFRRADTSSRPAGSEALSERGAPPEGLRQEASGGTIIK